MDRDWTEADIPDQAGRTFLVTGANSGIGFETAGALVRKGAHVVLACRSREKADEALVRIAGEGGHGTTEILEIDLADLESVRGAGESFLSSHGRLDVLVNNAGVMATPELRTAQGFEMQFGVNHLGHFALTGLLLPLLLESGAARVVCVSSQGHRAGRVAFDNLNAERRYSPWRAYFQSKLANLLFVRELQRRLGAAGTDVIAAAAHPGGSRTNLGHENPGGIVNGVLYKLRPVIEIGTQSAAMGSLPTLRAATDPTVAGGDYYGPDGFFEQRGHPVEVRASSRARDDTTARRLWEVSEKLTGVTYGAID